MLCSKKTRDESILSPNLLYVIFALVWRITILCMWLLAIYFDMNNSVDSNMMWIESTLDWNQLNCSYKYELDTFIKKVSMQINVNRKNVLNMFTFFL